VPATIFLTTGSLDSREPLWFELLAEAVKKTLRQFIDLEIDIPRRFWMRTQPERLQTNAELFRLLRVLDDAARRERLREILRQLGNVGEGARNDKLLTWDQIRLMKAHGIDFGGHTVTHPFLSRLLPSQAAWEVSECKRRVEAELQQPVYYFAYPNGREEDLGPFNKEVLRSAGYRAAMTTIWGVNHPTTDRMEMRRGGPWETNPALFASKLDWYHLANQ
jgi:peptidoglycan/xylan/chitin deacetylase (PgdA/CDA1 family)